MIYADIYFFVKYRNVTTRAVYRQKDRLDSLYTVFMSGPKILFHIIVTLLVAHLKMVFDSLTGYGVFPNMTSNKNEADLSGSKTGVINPIL